MNPAILHTFMLAGGFLALFGSAELMYHRFKVKCEYSRKYVHIITGLITLSFPVLLDNHWLVLFLCGSFAIILTLSLRLNLLKSINAINRKSRGSILYPIVVYSLYLVQDYCGNYIFFYIPILILAISDPLAALLGRKYPWGPYSLIKDRKTLMGSSVFFLSAFLISALLFYAMLGWVDSTMLRMALLLGFATALIEGISQNGYDNLTVPLLAALILLWAAPYLPL